VDALRDFGRDEALAGLDVGRELADLDEQPVVEDRAFLVVLPQAGLAGTWPGESLEHLLQTGV